MDTPNPYLNYTLAGEPVALFGMFLITTVLMAYVTLSGPSKSEESEETDETQFWFELIEEANLLDTSTFQHLKNEADELIKIFTATKNRMKN